MNAQRPKVSVLTPLYNTSESDLRAMIESVLNQTFTDFEFLLLNDSPDNHGLEKIVLSYNDARIKYSENPENLGITKSRNKLIDLALGEYLAVLDHDDISMPNRFQLQVDFLDKNPHIGVVGGNIIEIKNGKEISYSKRPIHDHDIKMSLVNEPYVCNPIHSASMIRKSVLIDSGIRYNQKWSPCEDHVLFLDLMDYTCFHNLEDIVLKYNWHGDNTTIRQWQKMYDLPPLIIEQARKKHPLYYDEWKNQVPDTSYVRRVLLFGFIPILKIKQCCGVKKIYLLGFIQLFRFK